MIGKVYLVGAGPGDPELITLKALKILNKANVIIYDRLVSKEILEILPKKTKKIYVGKDPDKKSIIQLSINKILIREAQRGNIVVRLKGGDPFIFGRGAEEVLILKEENIPFEVIPGVSSALAVPISAGIPLTHRKYASSIAIITGHEDATKKIKSVKLENLAKSVDTIIILMGVKMLRDIVNRLINSGLNPNTGVAIIENGTKLNERKTLGTLKNIIQKAQEEGIKAPAIIIIGNVVNIKMEPFI